MSTETRQPHNTAPRPSRRHRITGELAALALVAGGAGVAYQAFDHDKTAPTASSNGHHDQPKVRRPETKPAAGPQRIEDLPGYGQKVSAEQRKALQASTVQVVREVPDPKTGFYKQFNCNGVKIEINGAMYAMTAEHCLVGKGLDTITEFPQLNTSPDPEHDPTLHNPKAVPESLSGKVSIWTIGANGLADTQHPIPVERSVASKYPDMALLRVNKSSPNADKFNAVPAIDYVAARSGEPVPGAQAVLVNNELGSKLADTTGTFLGISTNPADRAQKLAWVLVDYNSTDKDGCYYEDSGSVAAIGDTDVTGPLAVRIQPQDFAGGVPEQRQREWRDDVAADLGVTFEGHGTTLCGFSVLTPDITQNMAQVAAAQ